MTVYTENTRSNSWVFTIKNISDTNSWSNGSKECSKAYPINWVQCRIQGETNEIEELLKEHKPKIIFVDIWEDETGIECDVRKLVGLQRNHTLIFPSQTKYDNLAIVLANRESNVVTPRLWRTTNKRGMTNILRFTKYIRKYFAANFVNMAKTYNPGEEKKLADVLRLHDEVSYDMRHKRTRSTPESSETNHLEEKSTHDLGHKRARSTSGTSETNHLEGKSTHDLGHKRARSAFEATETKHPEKKSTFKTRDTRRKRARKEFLKFMGRAMERSKRKAHKYGKAKGTWSRRNAADNDTNLGSNESSESLSSSSGSENSSNTSENSSSSSSSSSSSGSDDSSNPSSSSSGSESS